MIKNEQKMEVNKMNELSRSYIFFSLEPQFEMITRKINNIEFSNENIPKLEVWTKQIQNIMDFVDGENYGDRTKHG